MYNYVRLVHLLAMIVWLGTGLGDPVVADIRRTLALDIASHGPPLMDRLRTISKVVIPSAVVSVGTGFALIVMRGGFSRVPTRIHIGMTLAFLVFGVGGAFTSRAMKALGESIEAKNQRDAEAAAARITLGLRIEDSLRLAALLTMVIPFEQLV